MPTTPTYDMVVEDLQIDPERIAARPSWSFEVAERVRKHRKKALRSARPKKRTRQARTTQTQQARTTQRRPKQSQPKRATPAR